MLVLVPHFQLVWEHPIVHPPSCIECVMVPRTALRPHGCKGLALEYAWSKSRHMAGICVLDGDSAIDAEAVVRMERHIARDPGCIWTAPCRTWGADAPPQVLRAPAPGDERAAALLRDSPGARLVGQHLHITPRPAGDYAHRTRDRDGTPRWGTPGDDAVTAWGFGYTYLPATLLERVGSTNRWTDLYLPRDAADLADDRRLARIAQEEPAIPARLARGVAVVHMHWGLPDVERMRAALGGEPA